MNTDPTVRPSRFAALWIGPVCVLCAAVGFSAKAIFVKLVYPYGIDPVTVLALRMLWSLPFFGVMAWIPRQPRVVPAVGDWLAAVSLGLLGYYLSSLLDFYGLVYISVGLERLILFLYPTLVLVISAAMLHQSIGRREWAALFISYSGIVLAFTHDWRLGQADQVMLGSLLVFGAAVSYSGYILISGRYIQRLGVSRFTGLAMLSATAGVLAHFAVARPLTDLAQPPVVMWPIIGMALIGTVMPSLFLSEGLRRVGPSRTALLSTIGPVATIALGHAVLDEPVSVQQLAGAALVIGGVALVSVKKH